MKNRPIGRLMLLFLLAAALIWGGLRLYRHIFAAPLPAGQSDGSETAAKPKLPPLPLTPATMTAAQKQAAVSRARQNAEAAALAAGQSEAEAKQAGEAMEQAADAAFYQSGKSGGE